MTLPTITVTGSVAPPDNAAIGATVVFRLSGPDIDAATGAVVPREVLATVVEGEFTAAIWPTSRGVNGTLYGVSVHYPPASGAAPQVASLGAIAPDERSPIQALADLLRDAVSTPDPIVVSRAAWGALFLAAPEPFATVAAGLTATAADGYFLTAGAGGRAAFLWRKVNGAAVEVQWLAEVVE